MRSGRLGPRYPFLPRYPLMALGALALLAALWGGLLRLGWDLSPRLPSSAIYHGPLMVGGFLGTVIALERAVAVGRPWAYATPALAGLGAVALLLRPPGEPGPALIVLASLGLLATYVAIARQHFALHTATMALGALAWLVGNALWLGGWPIYRVVPWWAGFLVLTVAGERLELSRLLRPSRGSRAAFLAGVAAFLAGLLLGGFAPDAGARLAGAGLSGLALWLAANDVARRTVRQKGLRRFVAACMLAGYVWLGIAGALGLAYGAVVAGYAYDAFLHAVFLGFVFSMIFGHAPIVLPAVLGRPLAFRTFFYAPLALLHLSLALRVGSDLSAWLAGRQWGGLLNVVAVLLFLAATVTAARQASAGEPSELLPSRGR